MAPLPTSGVLASLADLLAVPPDQGGAVWRLSQADRQMDSNLIRLRPGHRVDGHVEPELDVLLCVLAGSGGLVTDGERQELAAGCVAWLPRGTHRALYAGEDGLVYVTAHRRRPGLTITRSSASGIS
ncbi:cupin domain-containing protein [Streptomyces sp. NPDC020681]|uniref:cupin domain-containing protein n=1 Tax=Streptomyces sp. NPDC020681 TaxID=3365083 RepID=UPI00379F7493